MTTLLVVGNSEGIVGRCDAKCYEATGPECDCICNGRNHGAGRQVAVERTAQLVDPTGELRERMEALGGTRVVSRVSVLEEPELPLGAPDDFEVAPTDDELRAALPPEELVPMLIDAAATVDVDARQAEKVGNKRKQAACEAMRDELIAEALALGAGQAVEEPRCASCGTPESVSPTGVHNENGRFCGDCTRAAMRWPVRPEAR